MVFYCKITAEQRALAWYLRKHRHSSYREVAKECGISKSTAERVCKVHAVSEGRSVSKRRTERTGRPRRLSERGVRQLVRTLKELRTKNAHLTVKGIVERSGLNFQMASRRTFSRYLNEQGYQHLQARKKGLLSENDCKRRVQFAQKMRRQVSENPECWMNEVSFYLDGVSFVHTVFFQL